MRGVHSSASPSSSINSPTRASSTSRPVKFSLEKAKRGVVLRSSNACEDVTPENAQKLFDRFYRADQSRSSGSGFGIGLSIARSIAEGHHGSIRAIVDDGKIAFTAELK